MEEKKDKTNEVVEQSVVEKILIALRQRIILIIAIIVLFVAIGFLYNDVRKPDYTVFETVAFTAQNTADYYGVRIDGTQTPVGTTLLEDNSDYYVLREDSDNHANATSKYADTVVQFFKVGVVSERAEYYYYQFDSICKAKKIEGSDERFYYIDQYLDMIRKTHLQKRLLDGIFNNSKDNNRDYRFDIKLSKIVEETKEEKVLHYEYYYDYYLDNVQRDSTGKYTYFFAKEGCDPVEVEDSIFDSQIDYICYSQEKVSKDLLEMYKFDEKSGLKIKGAFDIYQDGDSGSPTYGNYVYVGSNTNGLNFRKFENGALSEPLVLTDGDYDKILFAPYDVIFDKYVFVQENVDMKIYPSNITVSYNASEKNYILSVGYLDEDPTMAEEKVRIIVLATMQEANKEDAFASKDNGKGIEVPFPKNYKYFNIVKVNLVDLGTVGTTVNISSRRTLITFFIVGVIASLIIVYLLSLIDTTVDSKKELERITGVEFLAYISNTKDGGKNNG